MRLAPGTNFARDLLLFLGLADMEVEDDVRARTAPFFPLSSEFFLNPSNGDGCAKYGPHPWDAPSESVPHIIGGRPGDRDEGGCQCAP